jgi:hypothetical protein
VKASSVKAGWLAAIWDKGVMDARIMRDSRLEGNVEWAGIEYAVWGLVPLSHRI